MSQVTGDSMSRWKAVVSQAARDALKTELQQITRTGLCGLHGFLSQHGLDSPDAEHKALQSFVDTFGILRLWHRLIKGTGVLIYHNLYPSDQVTVPEFTASISVLEHDSNAASCICQLLLKGSLSIKQADGSHEQKSLENSHQAKDIPLPWAKLEDALGGIREPLACDIKECTGDPGAGDILGHLVTSALIDGAQDRFINRFLDQNNYNVPFHHVAKCSVHHEDLHDLSVWVVVTTLSGRNPCLKPPSDIYTMSCVFSRNISIIMEN